MFADFMRNCTAWRRNPIETEARFNHRNGRRVPFLDRVMSNILIIDDDVLMRGLVVEWLTAAGYRVSGVASYPPQVGTPADLVIVDVYMPRHLGVERLASARNAYPGVPIIAVSGQFWPGVGLEGRAAQALGVDRVVAKPFCREELLHAVRSVLGEPVVRPS